MNKREHIEISKAITVATICPDMAARNLATVHRSTRTQSTRDCWSMYDHVLTDCPLLKEVTL